MERASFSELASTIHLNINTLKESRGVLNQEFVEALQKKIQPFLISCQRVDQRYKEKDKKATTSDVERILSTLQKESSGMERVMQNIYRVGHAMFLMSTHYLVSRHLLKNPDFYAKLSANYDGNDKKLKS